MGADVLERTHRVAGPGWWQSGTYRLRCVCGHHVSASSPAFARRLLAEHCEQENEQ
jgi:hypothetical protein